MIYTVGDLREELKEISDDMPIVINLNQSRGITYAAIEILTDETADLEEGREDEEDLGEYIQILMSGSKLGYSAKQVNKLIK